MQICDKIHQKTNKNPPQVYAIKNINSKIELWLQIGNTDRCCLLRCWCLLLRCCCCRPHEKGTYSKLWKTYRFCLAEKLVHCWFFTILAYFSYSAIHKHFLYPTIGYNRIWFSHVLACFYVKELLENVCVFSHLKYFSFSSFIC